jgi:hypothetical protein
MERWGLSTCLGGNLKHDPPSEIVPNPEKKFLENFGEILTMFGELVNLPQR